MLSNIKKYKYTYKIFQILQHLNKNLIELYKFFKWAPILQKYIK